MKKILLLHFILFSTLLVEGQNPFPSYVKILKKFFSTHINEKDYENWVNFAKKKDGWYVQKLNRYKNDSVAVEMIFWSAKEKKYCDINKEFSTATNASPEDDVAFYLSGTNTDFTWYNYDRCPYYGYNSWQRDIINDYGTNTTLSDTLLEALARAYSECASRYLWYQYGSEFISSDTLTKKLGRLQIPSEQRIEKVNYCINKAIETYSRLVLQNPNYVTIVGTSPLKLFNECMNGYNQMIMALKDDEAKKYIDKINLDTPYIIQAKNYLNSCRQNAILFSYGDNDTYQLWYVQQKEGFRKDVTVINISLAGLAIYIDMLKKTNAVQFSVSASLYGNSSFDVSYFKKIEAVHENESVSLSQFVKIIRDKNYKDLSYQNPDIADFPYKKTYIDGFAKMEGLNDNDSETEDPNDYFSEFDIQLSNALCMNDYMIFDIINNNIKTRPIYFTSASTTYFDKYLQQEGIIYRLVSPEFKNSDAAQEASEKALEKFVTEKFQPVLNNNYNGKKIVCYDGSNTFFMAYAKIADYYSDKDDSSMARLWLNKALKLAGPVAMDNMPGYFYLAGQLDRLGAYKTCGHIFEMYIDYLYDQYKNPSPSKGYASKNDFLASLKNAQDYFKQRNINYNKISLLIKNVKASN